MHDALRRLDLNLLRVLDALYRHRGVTAAANELALSPSACSHALARLRAALDDALFVRYGSAMQPTALAERLAPAVGDALRALAEHLGGAGTFAPATSTQTFTFAATDYTASLLLPTLVARLEPRAPHLKLRVQHASHRGAFDALNTGQVHFVLGFSDEHVGAYEGVDALDGFDDDYVVAHRRDHPRIARTLSLKKYLAERHVAVLPWEDVGSVIDATLARQGLRRTVAVQLPSLMMAPRVVARSDLLLTAPRRIAEELAAAGPLTLHPAPFDTPRYTFKVYYHARHAGAAAHRWMREQLRLAASELAH